MSATRIDKELDEDELCRLASLVGTDARNPEANLVSYVREILYAQKSTTQHQLLDELKEQLPSITMQEVIDDGMFPTPEEYKKMVWLQLVYRKQVVSAIEALKKGLK